MKHFYYFSKNKLKFVEIKNFYRKFVFLVIFFSLVNAFLVFSGYFIVNEILNPDSEVKALQQKNRNLQKQVTGLVDKYENFENELNYILSQSNDLRLKVNLDPLTEEDRNIGVGGSVFEGFIPNNSSEFDNLLSRLNVYVDEIYAKLELEKSNYNEITNTLELNEKLYSSIPAIIPMEGRVSDSFGMRLHPILKVRRLHPGLDIVANVGTPVYSPGSGVVTFAGRRGGYGLTLEIDHGFGYKTLYAHLSKIHVKRGQKVTRGDSIAESGNSGKLSTGPHLHYEVRHNGIALNPKNFMYDDVELFEVVSNQ
ncbi:MAG: M23 family metallopeptidase [Melioribacteraceae bacterium]|nr:M23 family metallopeptidase [Melioribacteraceae bacterium]